MSAGIHQAQLGQRQRCREGRALVRFIEAVRQADLRLQAHLTECGAQ